MCATLGTSTRTHPFQGLPAFSFTGTTANHHLHCAADAVRVGYESRGKYIPGKATNAMMSMLVPSAAVCCCCHQVPIDICEQRDPKGLYKKARAGLVKGFTGMHLGVSVSLLGIATLMVICSALRTVVCTLLLSTRGVEESRTTLMQLGSRGRWCLCTPGLHPSVDMW